MPSQHARRRWRTRAILALTLATLFTFLSSSLAYAATLIQISSDPYTNSTSQHQTEVEPDTFAFGSTIVSAFQAGRFFNGGASNIGWATSTNSGATWTHDFLPGITKIVDPANPYDRVSDPSVAFDAAHNTWMISSLAILETPGVLGAAVIVNRSTDGGLTWGDPVIVHAASSGENLDKNWTACDNTATSKFFGHCYTEWDNNGAGNLIQMSTSTDGGLTWGAPEATANNATGIGGQPLVQPDGTVIVPIDNANETSLLSFISTDGGLTWSSTVLVTPIFAHVVRGSLRSGPLPTAEIDGAGRVFVVWQDCRFEVGGTLCRFNANSYNDLVMSTTTDGINWTAVEQIPADPVGSGVDHFIPGLAVDPATSGNTAHLVLTFYFYPNAICTIPTCELNVGSSSSLDGGSSWSARTPLTITSMNNTWLANTTQGFMVGDYISTSFADGQLAFPVFAVANAPSGGVFDEAMYTVSGGLANLLHVHRVKGEYAKSVPRATAGGASPPLTAR